MRMWKEILRLSSYCHTRTDPVQHRL